MRILLMIPGASNERHLEPRGLWLALELPENSAQEPVETLSRR